MNSTITKILNDKKNILITGCNGIGKSFLAYELMQNCNYFYFIGVVNQSFKLRKIPENDVFEFKTVTQARLILENDKKNSYEVKAYDSYGKYDTRTVAKAMGTKFLELIYDRDSEIRKEIVEALNEFGIEITEDNSLIIENIIFTVNDNKDISAGYQALLRLFTELFLLKKKNTFSFLIFLDEIAKSLDCHNSSLLLRVIEKYFPTYHFIITTHSYDLILSAKDFEIIKLSENKVIEYFDGNEFNSISEIRARLFNLINENKELNNKEKILYRLGYLIDALRKNNTKKDLTELINFLEENKSCAEESDKANLLWNYAYKIIEERK